MDKATIVKEWKHKGLTCIIRKNPPPLGNYCGYVLVPINNDLFGKDMNSNDLINLDVHGGVTYSNLEGGKWCIGFDYAHAGDYLEIYDTIFKDTNFKPSSFFYDSKKWTEEEVVKDVEGLAEQVKIYEVRLQDTLWELPMIMRHLWLALSIGSNRTLLYLKQLKKALYNESWKLQIYIRRRFYAGKRK